MHVDPYAPPKSVLTGTDNTTYLDHDGYASNSELVANKHFKSPLICAKLGIPIPPESLPEPKLITIKRVSRVSKPITTLISIFNSLAIFACIFYMESVAFLSAFFCYLLLSGIVQHITTKPYQIPFYFSEKYTRTRTNRICIFVSILIILALIIISALITRHPRQPEAISFSIIAGIITFIIYKFKITRFVVSNRKGEFLYIRGVHRGLLDALPHLPISS